MEETGEAFGRYCGEVDREVVKCYGDNSGVDCRLGIDIRLCIEFEGERRKWRCRSLYI
jgi:hypothetical protein